MKTLSAHLQRLRIRAAQQVGICDRFCSVKAPFPMIVRFEGRRSWDLQVVALAALAAFSVEGRIAAGLRSS